MREKERESVCMLGAAWLQKVPSCVRDDLCVLNGVCAEWVFNL